MGREVAERRRAPPDETRIYRPFLPLGATDTLLRERLSGGGSTTEPRSGNIRNCRDSSPRNRRDPDVPALYLPSMPPESRPTHLP